MRLRVMFAIAFSLVLLSAASAQDFTVKIIALNDLHGFVQSPGVFRANAQSPDVPVGGADFLAGYIAHLKSQNPYNIVVSAGDLTGASPLNSALFHDEDTVEVMNRMGLELNAVGNHEFDHGPKELMRFQHGGCSTRDSNTCKGAATGTPVPFEGAKFQYLAANTIDTATGKTLFPGYAIKTYNDVKVAFIGLTLKDTPSQVTLGSTAGLRFADEADTTNAIVRRLRKRGIESFVVLIHQGGKQTTKGTPDINACEGGLNGSSIQSIVNRLDDAVDLVLSAHTHLSYICQIPNSAGRKIPVTSAGAFGRVLTDIDVTLNKQTKKVTAVSAHNILVDRSNTAIKPDAKIKSIVDQYAVLGAPIVNREVGSITATIKKSKDDHSESSLADLIADAQLEATSSPGSGAAVIAFMNTEGARSDIPFVSGVAGLEPGKVTYGELFAAQPFRNILVTMTLTGEQIRAVLEEEFKGCAMGASAGDDEVPQGDRWLDVSEGFTYTQSKSGAMCNKVDPASMKLHGVTIDPAAKYRVTVNSYLADGGGLFHVFPKGTDRLVGPADIDAMASYFAKHPSIAPVQQQRINVNP
jgi:5'-nucleotidase